MKKLLTVFAIVLVLSLSIAVVALAASYPEGAVIAWGDRFSVTEIAGHTVKGSDVKVITEPTCTERGVAHYPCETCGDGDYHTLYLAPLGHKWASESGILEWGNILEKPTCTETGLAIDVCLRCHAVNPDKTRVIEKVAHVYSATTLEDAPVDKFYPVENKTYPWIGYFLDEAHAKYEILTKPTCANEGDAWRVCLVCGQADRTRKVSLKKTAHKWSDWKVKEAATCWSEGYVIRACAKCGDTEKLTKTNDLDEKGKPTNWIKLVQKRNPNWDNTIDAIKKNPANIEFHETGAYWQILKEEVWLTTCYTYNDVYVCPYCKCDTKKYPLTKHEKVKDYNLKLTSHKWNAKPEAAVAYTDSAEYSAALDKEREEYAYTKGVSVKATCVFDGFDLYKCEYEGKDSSWDMKHEAEDVHTRYKVVRVPALGHDWTKWELHETFELDGQKVYQYIRICKRCGLNETNVTTEEDPDENVLVSSITIKSKLTVKVGAKKSLTAKVEPAMATNKNVKWTTSNKKIATVSSKGVVKGKKKGTCIITCTALDGSGVQAMCKVTVK